MIVNLECMLTFADGNMAYGKQVGGAGGTDATARSPFERTMHSSPPMKQVYTGDTYDYFTASLAHI